MYKILVVDDSPMIKTLIKKDLKDLDDLECHFEKNGKKAIEKYKEIKPNLVTMDITMPEMDSIEASKEIIKMDPEAKIIMLSAMGDEMLINEAKEIGIKKFIKKPFKKMRF